MDRWQEEEDTGVAPSVWRYAKASRAHVVVDAAAYYELIQEAMLKARQRIFLIGWDFDTRMRLGKGRRWWNLPRRSRNPARLGSFIVWLVRRRRRLEIRILKWNFGALKFIFRGTMVFDLIRWLRHSRIDFKFDSAHPLGCSHHQKIVVIDDRFAVCGGIDMTSDRWDTPDHLHDDPRRKKPGGGLYGPWHDVTMLIEGHAARALGDLGRMRWDHAGGVPMDPCAPQEESPWPDRLVAEFNNVEIGVARTRAGHADLPELREIERLFVEQIGRAKRLIYAESQYFASRRVAEAIALKLAEPDPPEIVVINPQTAEGWLEQAAMDGARVRLLHAVNEADHAGRFRLYYPVTAGGDAIYVHAKLLIVDDEIIRIGSANWNNRSMGLDSECDVFIDATRPGNAGAASAISRLRMALLGEHAGVFPERVPGLIEEHGGMAAMIDALPRRGKHLEPFVLRPLTEAEKAIADSTFLDPERPGDLFEPIGLKRGLFRRNGILHKPK